MNTTFLLPRPQLVHGTFFTSVAFRVRGRSGREYGIIAPSDVVRFDVLDAATSATLAERPGIWKQWWEDGIRMFTKQSTTYIRANGWEVNVTRHPIYNYVSGPSRWRFDFSMRPLNGTFFSRLHGNASGTCAPHGIVGQSYDGDGMGISGRLDDYTYNGSNPVITTAAMAEGAIEGSATDYVLQHPFETHFRYDRFHHRLSDTCPPRDTRRLSGPRSRRTVSGQVGAAM